MAFSPVVNTSTIKAFINVCRLYAGLSVDGFSLGCGIGKNNYYAMRRGRILTLSVSLQKICTFLNISFRFYDGDTLFKECKIADLCKTALAAIIKKYKKITPFILANKQPRTIAARIKREAISVNKIIELSTMAGYSIYISNDNFLKFETK